MRAFIPGMNLTKIIPVVLSIFVIILVAVIQERSKPLAAIIATMPVSVPLALWIAFSHSNGDHAQAALFTRNMILGIIATTVFIIAAWLAFRQRLSFPIVIGIGYLAWAIVAFLPKWLASLWR